MKQRDPAVLKELCTLLEGGSWSYSDMETRLGVKEQTLRHYLRELRARGYNVVWIKRCWPKRFTIAPSSLAIPRPLGPVGCAIRFRLSAALTPRQLQAWTLWRYKIGVDNQTQALVELLEREVFPRIGAAPTETWVAASPGRAKGQTKNRLSKGRTVMRTVHLPELAYATLQRYWKRTGALTLADALRRLLDKLGDDLGVHPEYPYRDNPEIYEQPWYPK
jgi:hypothetical protein